MALARQQTVSKPTTTKSKLGREKERGGLWVKTSQDGKEYMTGDVTVNGTKIQVIVFPNNFKEGLQPDYRIYERDAVQD